MNRQQEEQVNDNNETEILEQGDIYFFYRPKKGAEVIAFPVGVEHNLHASSADIVIAVTGRKRNWRGLNQRR